MPSPNSCTLFLFGLNPDTRARDLGQEFERYGRIVRCDIPVPRPGQPTVYAFVEFEDERDAEEALMSMNGRRWQGQYLRVTWAKNSVKPNTKYRDHSPSSSSHAPASGPYPQYRSGERRDTGPYANPRYSSRRSLSPSSRYGNRYHQQHPPASHGYTSQPSSGPYYGDSHPYGRRNYPSNERDHSSGYYSSSSSSGRRMVREESGGSHHMKTRSYERSDDRQSLRKPYGYGQSQPSNWSDRKMNEGAHYSSNERNIDSPNMESSRESNSRKNQQEPDSPSISPDKNEDRSGSSSYSRTSSSLQEPTPAIMEGRISPNDNGALIRDFSVSDGVTTTS